MFVNKTILNEAGYDVPDEDWTWEDFYEIVKGVTGDTDGDGEYDTFGVCGYRWRQAAYTNDAQFYDEEADRCQSFVKTNDRHGFVFAKDL